MKFNLFRTFKALAVLACLLSAASTQAGSLTDYGAVPAVTKPPGDQSAANQKLDFHTDLFTGRFNYRIPIEVPPGRQGSEPALALQYNSSGGNGWCGVGWDLDLGYIQRETRYGVPISNGSYSNTFVFSVAGQNGRLILASDGTYRPEVNTAFLKFVYANGYWMVTDKDGRQYTFGDTSSSRLATSYGTFKWALSKIVDPNGNATTITYQTVTGSPQLYLYQITYNANPNSPAIAANCAVTFALTSAARPDIPSSCLSGAEIDTTRLLQAITVTCNGSQVRQYALGYATSSSTGRSLLNSVTEYGVDGTWAWPSLTFSYSAQAQSFQSPVAWPIVSQTSPGDPYGTSPATPDAQLVDINGDGLPDWVTRPLNSPFSYFNVQTNMGNGFGSTRSWVSVSNENNDVSAVWNDLDSADSHMIDINGDGLPDRVLNQHDPPRNHFQVQLNTGTGFAPVSDWPGVSTDPSSIYYTAGTLNVPYAISSDGVSSLTTLADMNGDGLPDRVMVGSANNRFDVQLNTGSGFSSIRYWNNVIASGPGSDSYYAPRARNNTYVYSELMDMNGDGLPDRVIVGGVQLNNGVSGFGAKESWGMGSSDYPGVLSTADGANYTMLIDMNGDGLPDRVTDNQNGTWTVQINTGSGFGPAVTWTGVSNGGHSGNGWYAPQAWDVNGTRIEMMDMNGDGLPDRVIRETGALNGTDRLLVQLNSGPFPDLLIGADNGMGGYITVAYTNAAHWNNSDGTRFRLPMPVYTVTSVHVDDGIRAGQTWNYSYTGGLYDTIWREFRGFAIVSEASFNGMGLQMTNVTYFYQGGGLYSGKDGEYQDSRFKTGMPWNVITYGSDGQFYKDTFNIVDQVRVDPNGVYFPYVTNVFMFDAEPGANPRATLKQYRYNVTQDQIANSTGNLLEESDWGEVTNVYTVTDFYGNTLYTIFTDVPDAPVYTTYTYATLSNPNIIDKPASVTVSADAAGNNVLHQTLYQYFGQTGDLQQKSDLICPGTYAVTSYTYDNYGNLKTTTDPVNIVTTMDYDSATATYPWRKYTGSLTNCFLYDPRTGNTFCATNEQGLVTSNAYDGLLRLTNSAISTTANGAPTLWRSRYQYSLGGMNVSGTLTYNYVYNQQNDPASATGYHETYTYLDGLGRVIQVRDQSETNNQYRTTDVFYNPLGAIMAQTYPVFSGGAAYVEPSGTPEAVWTEFDPIGRPYTFYPCAAVTLDPYGFGLFWYATPFAGDTGSPVGPVTLNFKDGNNPWALVVTDARNKVHKYLLDAFGRTNQIVEVVGTNNYTTTLAYNQVGDLTNITDNAGNKIAMFYDLRGRQVALADPDMGFWQWGYDLDGRLKTQTDAKGQQIKFYYNDAAGRLTRREGWSAGGQCLSTNTWAYDSNSGDSSCAVYPGQVYQITDDQGWQKYSYDVRDRTLKSVRYLSKNGNTYTNQFAFDDADRLTSTLYPNGGPTSHQCLRCRRASVAGEAGAAARIFTRPTVSML